MVIFWCVMSMVIFLVFRYFKDNVFFCLFIGSVSTTIGCLFSNRSLIQIGIFIVSTLLCIAYFKNYLFRKLNPINLSDLIGKQAVVTSTIGDEPGLVKLNGDRWHAKSLGAATYKRGDVVYIVGIKGLYVFVS